MNEVIEHLVQALCSLTKEEKVEVINRLLKDAGFREVLSELPIKKLIGSQDNQEVKYSLTTDSGGASRSKGKKERGKQLRENYISELQQSGILIEQFGGQWSETEKGLWAAIPTANVEGRSGGWFLGVLENKVLERINKGGVVIILLCRSADGVRLDFVIPPHIVKEVAPKLSKSKGQLKFHVRKIGNHYHLIIPNDNPVDILDYKGAVSILQSRI